VAAIAVHAVVDVPTHVLVLAVGARLRVAIRALEHRVVIRIGMAGGTYPVRTAMIHRKPCVIESGSQPAGRAVAGDARGRETNRNVIRVGRACVVQLVAAVAVRGHGGVVVVHVATGARDRRMRTRQRERRVVVIERGRTPCRRAVTHVALLREPGARVIWVRRPFEVVQVARHTSRAGQAVGPGRAVGGVMALIALQGNVRPRQGPPSHGVVEARWSPCRRAVADFALLRQTASHVVRTGRRPEIGEVAAHARRYLEVVVPLVALVTLELYVRSGQRKRRLGMIK